MGQKTHTNFVNFSCPIWGGRVGQTCEQAQTEATDKIKTTRSNDKK
jgi:hypothetical protein